METRYNIYFSGQVADGEETDSVRTRLAKVFNADDVTLDKLFSGTPQLLKRNCDKTTALKYKQAMERAGARPIIKVIEAAAPAEAPPPAAMSSAEKIAALAAAPDESGYTSTPGKEEAPADSQAVAEEHSTIELTPSGTEVLREEERSTPVERDIDTSALEIDISTDRLSEQAAPSPPGPDTSHLSMGEVGESIPTLPHEQEPVSPDIDSLVLSPEGTDFSDCAAPEAQQPDLDLSRLDLAPEGADVLDEKYRDKKQVQAPDTDHITLED